ncbi:pilus assembly protein TadG-related protein [Brachybacterium phenoliresistens]|uniref:pilus assembly protein TadG-related protein n=1 Tax=Brachybacterium phenoliresistens TaxID=396014 RepID=UPI0031D3076F
MSACGPIRRRARALRAALAEDSGTMTILTTGVVAVVLMVIALGVAITGVHLERNGLQHAADGAALAASQTVDEAGLYTPGAQATTTPALARRAAEDFLARYPLGDGRLRDVGVARVDVAEDGTVSVTLTGRVDPPLVGWFTSATDMSIPLTTLGEARAR